MLDSRGGVGGAGPRALACSTGGEGLRALALGAPEEAAFGSVPGKQAWATLVWLLAEETWAALGKRRHAQGVEAWLQVG